MRFVVAVLILLPAMAVAETAYVTDTLQLGLHRAADTSDQPFRSLDSGQAVEILDRTRYYAHVQLPDGTEGYVKAAYLVSDKPAKLIVAETQADRDRLVKELEETKKAFTQPAATIDALKQKSAELEEELDTGKAKIAELDDENAALRNRQQQYAHSMPLTWVAGAAGACLIAGFIAGLAWIDYRSRRRHGGIRIY